jgi:hypothetical protein
MYLGNIKKVKKAKTIHTVNQLLSDGWIIICDPLLRRKHGRDKVSFVLGWRDEEERTN